MSASIRYRPEIDGLRCFAVLAVIIFHVKESFLPGGYLGVDVFFVISGYLITSIILRETADGDFSLAKFWDRRIKRILPAASVVLLVVSVVQSLILFRPDLQQLLNQKIACLLSFANVSFFVNAGDYWGNAAEESPFLHYWSLSLEEQYYLLYPIFLVVLIRTVRTHLTGLLLFMVIASFAIFAYGATHYPSATFYLLPARMWQLGAGCLLAVSSNSKPFGNTSLGTLTGIALIGLSFLFPVSRSGIGYEALAAVVGACLVISSGSNRISAMILQNRSAVFIGRISYSLYLWHWPIIVCLKKIRDYGTITSNALIGVIGLASLLLLSLLSFYLIERPFRKLKYGTPIVLSFAIAVGIYFVAFESNFLKRSYTSQYEVPSYHGEYYDLKPRGELSETFKIIANSVHTPERKASVSAYKEGGIIRHRSSAEPRVVLIGDSHAVMWSKVVDEVTEELALTTSLWSMNGESGLMHVPPLEEPGRYITKNERFEYDNQRQFFINKWNPDIVIVACRWEFVDGSSASELFQFLELNAKNVLLVESPPVLDNVGNRSLYQYLSFLGIEPSSSPSGNLIWEQVSFIDTIATREKVMNFAFDRSNYSFLPTADLFVSDHGVNVASGSHVFYYDDDHLTDEGAELAKERLKNAIQNIISGNLDQFPIVTNRGKDTNKTLDLTALPRIE